MSPALVVFTSCQNSYPFQERHVYLREPVKIGRAVARSPPAKNNAIFDCKVLSRNHALLWFDHNSGKFYLQDTGSSNGTFINSTRLSHAHQHGPPSQIFTGDIIQFGVDVTESSCNVTHGCVVSSICLFLPDGVEASHRAEEDATPPQASPATSPLPVWKVAESTPSVYSLELFQLSQYLKEALQREQMLEQKLVTLQWLLGRTQEASEASFQAVVDEDQLLSRLEVMENMLQALSGNQCEGRVLELAAYQSTAKEALRRVLREKVEVCQTLSKVELSLSSAQDTCLHLQHLREHAEQELTELASKYSKAVSIIQGLTHTIKLAERQQEEQLQKHLQEKMELQLLIQSLEEQEQEPQTNSDTKECLQSVQGCLEQHQHKITKSHFLASPFSGLLQCLMNEKTLTKEWFLPPPSESLMDASGWTVSGTLSSVEDCTMHSTGRMEEKKDTEAVNNVTLLTEDCGSGELQSREAELQSRGVELQSREAELQSRGVELQSREAKLQSREAELNSREVELRSREAELQSGEAEHVARLNSQLHEAQDQASSSQSRCVELQDVLEKERREAQLHSQESANQIQALQAQVQKLQEEVQVLCAERACVVSRAQEEVLLLQGAVEASASERKKERTALQESLAAVTAELDRGRRRAAECEQESSSLKTRLQELQLQSAQAAQLQGELQKNCFVLQTECAALCSEKTALQENMQHLEKELHSSRDQAALLGRSVNALERTQGELESRLAEQQEQRQQDRARLKAQLDQATARIKGLQREYEDTQVELVQVKQRCSEVEQEKLSLSEELHQCKDSLKQLQERYEDTQVELVQVKQRCSEVEQEKLSLSEELHQCKGSLKQLQERASRPSLQPVLAMLVGVVLAVLFWGYSSLW
ncbi:sarcolemmal membrane-associated protein-like isoform X2 [Anguilla rostrata]|uniref:sarcolemmal membrane-associated protein-like isoform X2 n=1 Tax=Anguilla rostrata TaxID=7938 RepID=UPI0030D3E9A4